MFVVDACVGLTAYSATDSLDACSFASRSVHKWCQFHAVAMDKRQCVQNRQRAVHASCSNTAGVISADFIAVHGSCCFRIDARCNMDSFLEFGSELCKVNQR